ncbi:unnamed protein product [Allacma fusca]|uniref:Uncharacterized protein n=1 Tax=Allacma fusca TaxID=39272 RepID=A0A8J2LGI0_9HEXA|nr:unnamed protein product [Allacma fusca]
MFLSQGVCIAVVLCGILSLSSAKLESPEASGYYDYDLLPKIRLAGQAGPREFSSGHSRVKRGAAYPGGHGDFSGVAKMSTFASLGSYGGFLGHSGGAGGSVAGGYNAGSGRNGAGGDGGITISGALGSYGGYLGHKSPVVLSSGGYGNGGLLFGKI